MNNELSSLEELKALAEAAGYNVVAQVTQIRRADPRFQIGAGKVAEIQTLIKETQAEKLIFDNRLRPIQLYNLSKATGIEAIDRFKLILEIFTKNAQTKEAKLQIKLATLEYERIHATQRVRLSKLTEQPGFMGLGAYEREVYQEAINRQINTILRKLEKIRDKRLLHRKRRSELGFLSISLAGYTGAGKSTLFNSLANENVEVNQSLFTTLTTTTRLLEFSNRKFLLIDTVGFIDRLPLSLIEAFHSTLEETIYSNLILLVLDFSESIDIIKKKNRICLNTIKKIDASKIPIITVLNKIDCIPENEISKKLKSIKINIRNPVLISALYKKNLDLLRQEILKNLERFVELSFSIPTSELSMTFISWLHEKTNVKKTTYNADFVTISLRTNPLFAMNLKKKVKELNGKFEAVPKNK